MIKLFTGIDLPKSLKAELSLMHGGIEHANWTLMENYHITLAFIGNVDEALGNDIHDIMSNIRSEDFYLTLHGCSTFSKGDHLSHLWIGIEPCEELSHLKRKIDTALQKNFIPFDNRRYTPHVCIAKFRGKVDEDQVARFVQDHNLFKSRSFKVDNFILYQSFVGKQGHIYQPEAVYPLE